MTTATPTTTTRWDDGGASTGPAASLRELAMRYCVLPLSPDSHKGSSGRVAVLGGNAQYAGAPYYAALSALKAGADLSYVLTAEEAAAPIKCYSPELMVLPVYSATAFTKYVNKNKDDEKDSERERLIEGMVGKVMPMLERVHCLVIGPGLGRCPLVMEATSRIIRNVVSQNELYVVLDADALFMLSQPEYRTILQGYEKVVLTPNVVEYERLFPDRSDDSENNDEGDGGGKKKTCDAAFASATIIRKGKRDVILGGDPKKNATASSSGDEQQSAAAATASSSIPYYVCEEPGGLKRSGGIGDVLSGTVATLAAWHSILLQQQQQQQQQDIGNEIDDGNDDYYANDLALSCWTACCFVRRATYLAYQAKKRSMTAPDVLDCLGKAVDEMTT